jgi:hypothetical protein
MLPCRISLGLLMIHPWAPHDLPGTTVTPMCGLWIPQVTHDSVPTTPVLPSGMLSSTTMPSTVPLELLRPPSILACLAKTLPCAHNLQSQLQHQDPLIHLNAPFKLLQITCTPVRRVALLYLRNTLSLSIDCHLPYPFQLLELTQGSKLA